MLERLTLTFLTQLMGRVNETDSDVELFIVGPEDKIDNLYENIPKDSWLMVGNWAVVGSIGRSLGIKTKHGIIHTMKVKERSELEFYLFNKDSNINPVSKGDAKYESR